MKDITPAVSIIIPVYNVKEYLAKSVESVLSQSFDNLELILVDDGSTDGSAELCDEFERSDKRVRTIHQQNCGAGNARNKGLSYAKGKYVYFVDSDDYIDKDLINDNVAIGEKYDSDIILFGLYIEKTDEKGNIISQIPNCCAINGNYSKKELFEKYFYIFFKTRPLTHCVRIYKRSFVEKYSFAFGSEPIGEDRKFVLQASKADDFNIYINSKPYYHYVQHNVSAIRKYYKEGYSVYSLQLADIFEKITKDAGVKDKKSLGLVSLKYAEAILYELQNITNLSSPLTKRQQMKIIKNLMNNVKIRNAVYNVPVREVRGHYSRLTVLLLRMRAYKAVFWLKKLW